MNLNGFPANLQGFVGFSEQAFPCAEKKRLGKEVCFGWDGGWALMKERVNDFLVVDDPSGGSPLIINEENDKKSWLNGTERGQIG